MLTIYSNDNCPGCTAVKAILLRFSIPFEVRMVADNEEAKAFFIAKCHRTVPQVYAGAEYVGDFSVLSRMTADELLRVSTKQQNKLIKS